MPDTKLVNSFWCQPLKDRATELRRVLGWATTACYPEPIAKLATAWFAVYSCSKLRGNSVPAGPSIAGVLAIDKQLVPA